MMSVTPLHPCLSPYDSHSHLAGGMSRERELAYIMHVTHIALRATEASLAAGRPQLTPELLAVCGARYSRNNEGLEAVLARIDYARLDQSVDNIFRMIDYGHQSIADMVPVAIFIDDISLWLAYYVWTLCATAGGQESSTRYLQLDIESMIPPAQLGIPEALHEEWHAQQRACFAAYHAALAYWEGVAVARPEVTRIPRHIREDPSDKAQKQLARMLRNYAFDRARYFLPSAVATNMMLLMSARGWVSLCQHLLSHPLPEARQLGEALRDELTMSAPRLLRHARRTDSITAGMADDFTAVRQLATDLGAASLADGALGCDHPPIASLEVFPPAGVGGFQFAHDLAHHDTRYAWMGSNLKRTTVRFAWQAVSFAEIRDLNRHRTGNKYCPFAPVGFYAAQDQQTPATDAYRQLCDVGRAASARARALLLAGDPAYLYWTLLGTQYPFEHITTADKFLYEAELRTGIGAHYRYARHLHDALELWYARYPETRGLVLEGSAEPE